MAILFALKHYTDIACTVCGNINIFVAHYTQNLKPVMTNPLKNLWYLERSRWIESICSVSLASTASVNLQLASNVWNLASLWRICWSSVNNLFHLFFHSNSIDAIKKCLTVVCQNVCMKFECTFFLQNLRLWLASSVVRRTLLTRLARVDSCSSIDKVAPTRNLES